MALIISKFAKLLAYVKLNCQIDELLPAFIRYIDAWLEAGRRRRPFIVAAKSGQAKHKASMDGKEHDLAKTGTIRPRTGADDHEPPSFDAHRCPAHPTSIYTPIKQGTISPSRYSKTFAVPRENVTLPKPHPSPVEIPLSAGVKLLPGIIGPQPAALSFNMSSAGPPIYTPPLEARAYTPYAGYIICVLVVILVYCLWQLASIRTKYERLLAYQLCHSAIEAAPVQSAIEAPSVSPQVQAPSGPSVEWVGNLPVAPQDNNGFVIAMDAIWNGHWEELLPGL